MTTPADKFTFTPIDQAVIPPKGLIEHIKDRYWLVHPEKGIAYYQGRSPMCNGNLEIVERFLPAHPWAEIKFIPSVFRKINPNDYVG